MEIGLQEGTEEEEANGTMEGERVRERAEVAGEKTRGGRDGEGERESERTRERVRTGESQLLRQKRQTDEAQVSLSLKRKKKKKKHDPIDCPSHKPAQSALRRDNQENAARATVTVKQQRSNRERERESGTGGGEGSSSVVWLVQQPAMTRPDGGERLKEGESSDQTVKWEERAQGKQETGRRNATSGGRGLKQWRSEAEMATGQWTREKKARRNRIGRGKERALPEVRLDDAAMG